MIGLLGVVGAWLKPRAFSLISLVAHVLTIALSVAYLVASARLRDAVAQRDALQASIDAPVTGWAARLATCQGNAGVLQAGIKTQSTAIDELGAEGRKRLAAAEADLVAARKDTARAQARVSALLQPLSAGDACRRAVEADDRFLEALR